MQRSLLLVLLALFAVVGACGGDDDDGGGGGDAGSGEDGPAIVIEGSAFSSSGKILPDQPVTVRNEDGFAHTLTPDEDGAFEGVELDGGESGEVEFADPGTYSFHCEIHTSMKGRVEVAEA